ncbi:MAG: ATP-binding protein [Minisyncoccia bacterium]
MSTLHIICGVPCSGKSTLAKKLEKEHPALRLTPDEWMDRIVGDGYNEAKREIVEKIQCEIAEQALKLGVDVILENGFWTRKERDDLRDMAKRIGAVAKVYYFDVTRDELIRRLRERNKNLPKHNFHLEEHQIDEALKLFEAPTLDEPDLVLVS